MLPSERLFQEAVPISAGLSCGITDHHSQQGHLYPFLSIRCGCCATEKWIPSWVEDKYSEPSEWLKKTLRLPNSPNLATPDCKHPCLTCSVSIEMVSCVYVMALYTGRLHYTDRNQGPVEMFIPKLLRKRKSHPRSPQLCCHLPQFLTSFHLLEHPFLKRLLPHPFTKMATPRLLPPHNILHTEFVSLQPLRLLCFPIIREGILLDPDVQLINMYGGFLLLNSCKVNRCGERLYLMCQWSFKMPK